VKAVFLDRDGVLVRDVGLVTRPEQLQLYPGSAEAVRRLKNGRFAVVVVTNQPVVARGQASEADVAAIHERLQEMLVGAGGARVDAFYVCAHHPQAEVPRYRRVCDCRKPRPGLILRAARELHLRLEDSYLVGDRLTDIVAGRRAGCRTILVATGMHNAPPIFSVDPLDPEEMGADVVCADLQEAAAVIEKEAA
jgi:D-glycero-D-manno-heptose 1,7-bisphosphate phosphatase